MWKKYKYWQREFLKKISQKNKKVDKEGRKMGFIVGIDGPAGSGKGTITKKIANLTNLVNIDTGITYRCVALEALRKKAIQNGIIDKEKTIEIAKEIKIDIDNTKEGDRVFLHGEEVTRQIREKNVTEVVSPVSSIKEVRLAMVELQRKLAKRKRHNYGGKRHLYLCISQGRY